MSTWQQILALPEAYRQQINSIYESSTHFIPLSIRRCLAPWIEAQDWTFYTAPGATFDGVFFQRCCQLLQNFIHQLEVLSVSCNSADAFQVGLFLASLQRSLDMADYEILRHVGDCLQAERTIIQQYQDHSLLGDIEHFEVAAANLNIPRCDLEAECLKIHKGLLNTASLVVRLEQLQARSMFFELNALYQNDLMGRHQEIIGQLEATVNLIITDLTNWKNSRTKKTSNYSEFYEATEQCQALGSSLMQLWKQLKKVEGLVGEGHLRAECRTIKERVTRALKSLINASFTINQQPCQVIKTNLKLKRIVVNCLLGNLLSGTMTLPTVKVNLINEHQARQLFDGKDEPSLAAPKNPDCGYSRNARPRLYSRNEFRL